MSDPDQTEIPSEGSLPAGTWHPGTRIAFRVSFVYFGLYILLTQMFTTLFILPVGDLPELGSLGPFPDLVTWVGVHLLGFSSPMVIRSGSGDKPFDWTLVSCFLVIALVATTTWSVLDRKRRAYPGLYSWFRLTMRFAVGSTMITYGAAKIIPLQMGYGTSLARLIEPYGNFSPMGVLWSFVGASPVYQSITGCAELLGGVLLIVPRTATLGALVCLANSAYIFTLNMTYDVPVKLLSFHLVLMSLFLLAPDARRLANFFLLGRAAAPGAEPPLARSPRGRRIGLLAQLVFGAYLVGVSLYGSYHLWGIYGGGVPKAPFYGIWNVEEMKVDGEVLPALLTDESRWQRVLFDYPNRIGFQRMNASLDRYTAVFGVHQKQLTLGRFDDETWEATFTVDQPAPDQLTFQGEMDGSKMELHLRLLAAEDFELTRRGFHWVQEYPYNR